jgi:hypothetical protein
MIVLGGRSCALATVMEQPVSARGRRKGPVFDCGEGILKKFSLFMSKKKHSDISSSPRIPYVWPATPPITTAEVALRWAAVKPLASVMLLQSAPLWSL